MSKRINRDFEKLKSIGINGFPERWLTDEVMAKDAALVTTASNGVPAYLTNYTHPKVIEVLTAKRAAEDIFEPMQSGSYGDSTAIFPVGEATGYIAPYGDYAQNGMSDINTSWATREAYYFQTFTGWGDLESARFGKARIDAAGRKQAAAMLTLKIAHNKIWFYGVDGLNNYGILNDPDLLPSATPIPSAAGDLKWEKKSTKERYNDILALFSLLVKQSGGNVDSHTRMKLILSSQMSAYLGGATDFNVSVEDMLKKQFPYLEIVTAPEFDTEAGSVIQLHALEVDGQIAGWSGYIELVRVHGVIRQHSAFSQKNSASNCGAIIAQPTLIATMLGV